MKTSQNRRKVQGLLHFLLIDGSSVADPEPDPDPEGSETFDRIQIRSGIKICILDPDTNPHSNPDPKPDPKYICKKECYIHT